MTSADFATRINGAKPPANHGGWWSGYCPVPSHHDVKKPSLGWRDGEKKIAIKCQAGCGRSEVLVALGLVEEDTWLLESKAMKKGKPQIVSTYDYRDENGVLLYQSVRYAPKTFSLRRPLPEQPGEYIGNVTGTRLVLYQLNKLQASVDTQNRP